MGIWTLSLWQLFLAILSTISMIGVPDVVRDFTWKHVGKNLVWASILAVIGFCIQFLVNQYSEP